MDFKKLKNHLNKIGEPKYRYNQIASEIVGGRARVLQDIFAIPKSLRVELEKEFVLISNQEKTVLVSKDQRAYKALLELSDGHNIETVLLNPKPGLWSVCISCQIGCPMACTFCATGSMGFVRNLTAEEISDQILFWRQYITKNQLKIRISNIVYMGMGEPFANKEEVFESIEILTDKEIYGFGQRHISVSTSGVIPGIEEFTQKYPQINLAVSLHAPNDMLRNELMPVNKAFPLEKLIKSLIFYLEKTNRQLFIEYILLSGKNDLDKYAVELGNLLNDNFENFRHLLHVNLIVYNPTSSSYHMTDKEQAQKFKRILEHYRISVSIRKNLGREIQGACGQLTTSSK